MARGGKREGAGRIKGVPNKRTQKALFDQARGVHEAQKTGKKLAKEVLDEFMHLTAGMAAAYQPLPPGTDEKAPLPPGRIPDEKRFWQAVEMTRDFAKALAPFQSPTFKAIAVIAPPPAQEPLPHQQRGGNIIELNDVDALARVYRQRIAGVR